MKPKNYFTKDEAVRTKSIACLQEQNVKKNIWRESYSLLCAKCLAGIVGPVEYLMESLKRGGKFYLCWVADSWPLRFATITHRQLWSNDIRKICDNLLEVMTNESGRPAKRFSLRLSSQLMRGLVRLYQRKITVFLAELCMLNANVTKHINKKSVFHQEVKVARIQHPRVVIDVPENEERVEDILQRSGNVVANIEDITLKESALPAQAELLNDNFGELNPDQTIQLLVDKTLEVMMAQDLSAAQQSIELPQDFSTDKSHDKSRLALRDPTMERISEYDMTLFRKSAGEEVLPIDDVTNEIPGIPELPELPLPVLPDPPSKTQTAKQVVEDEHVGEQAPAEQVPETIQNVPEVSVLEELEERQPPVKRRRVRARIVDKNIKLSSNYMRARVGNCAVELRCEDSSKDVMIIRVPSDSLLARPAHAGPRVSSALGHTVTALFVRNLGTVNKCPLAEREMEVVMSPRNGRSQVRSMLEKIDEEVEPVLEHVERQQMEAAAPMLEEAALTLPQLTVDEIAELPTQLIQRLSQTRKRTAELERAESPKTPRRFGYASFRESLQVKRLPSHVEAVPAYEQDKENIPDNISQEFHQRPSNTERDLTSMLQEAGLADLQPRRTEPQVASPKVSRRTRRDGSEDSETPLGSLDRTKVSLGDSERTTDSMRFIRGNWGTEGTMIKIIKCVKEGAQPLDVRALVNRGPVVAGLKSIIAARCFTSILKLKQHNFINVDKDPETLEIVHITLGAKFDLT